MSDPGSARALDVQVYLSGHMTVDDAVMCALGVAVTYGYTDKYAMQQHYTD